MDENFKKLKKIVKFMQSQGVLTYKTSEIELTLSPAAVFHVERTKIKEPPTTQDEPQYSEEDVLMWSSPIFPPNEAN